MKKRGQADELFSAVYTWAKSRQHLFKYGSEAQALDAFVSACTQRWSIGADRAQCLFYSSPKIGEHWTKPEQKPVVPRFGAKQSSYVPIIFQSLL